MARRRHSVPVRLPGDLGRQHEPGGGGPSGEEVALRLAVSRRGLGLELSRPVELGGGLRLDEVVTALPGLRFPIDLSGGVRRFRHCRGRLERMALALGREPLVRWAETALDGLLGAGRPAVSVAPAAGGVSLGVAVGAGALAWELSWAPLGRDLCLVAHDARALGVEAPAMALALDASERLLGGQARRQGAVFRVENAPHKLLQEVLPRAGARLPSTDGVVWSHVETGTEALRLVAEQGGVPASVSAGAVRALEVAELLEAGDDALADGDRERAREAYLEALGRAPRQREVVLRLADLDRAEGGRIEAALATLVSALPAVDAGPLGGVLLGAVGDAEGARVAFERAAAAEPHGSLAALCLVEAARRAGSAGEAAALLGAAVVRAPGLGAARWQRLEVLTRLGDERGALAEAEHLEALAAGGADRLDVLLRAGGRLLAGGLIEAARRTYERALRARPSSAEGLRGLADAFFRAGDAPRAADVLGRAVALGEAQGQPDHAASVLLARVLAEGLHELPLAIARARAVPPSRPEALAARHLEARALAQLGDRSGASLAYAALREAVEHGRAADPIEVARWLGDGARFEEEARGDLGAAKRHLGVALRLRPRDPALLAAFRRVAAAHEAELEALRPGGRVTYAEPARPTGLAPYPEAPDSRRPDGRPAASGRVDHPELPDTRQPVASGPVDHPEPPHDPETPAEAVGEPSLEPFEPLAPVEPIGPTRDGAEPAAAVSEPPEAPASEEPVPASGGTYTPTGPGGSGAPLAVDFGLDDDPSGNADDEALAERLTGQVRADPTDLEVVLELAGVLERLGRDLDLFALFSARLEEGDEMTQQVIRPLQRGVLRRLAEAARQAGRESEASLYEMMAAGL